MTTRSRLDVLRSLVRGGAARRSAGPRPRARPGLEALEDRTVPSTIQGTVFTDTNQDGVFNPGAGDWGIANWIVYLDTNQSGQCDNGEALMFTGAGGAYSFTGLPAGTYTVATGLRQPIYAYTQPATGSQAVTFATDGETATGVNFGNALTSSAPAQTEFLVNSTIAGSQSLSYYYHTVAADSAGNFVVVWSGNGPGDSSGIFAQRYSAAGARRGGEFRVNATTTNSQYKASVAMSSTGNFAVIWQDGSDVKARLFDSAGNPRSGEFQVQRDAVSFAVAMDDNGNFVVTYETKKNITRTLYAQRYNAAGSTQGKAIALASYKLVNNRSSVAMDAVGDFVVTWHDIDGPTGGAFQRVDRFGNKQGGVVSAPGGWPTVDMDAAGNFVIACVTPTMRVQIYNANGTPRGSLIDVWPDSWEISVAMRASGDIAVAWTNGMNVYFRRHDANGVPLGDTVVANLYTVHPAIGANYPSMAMSGGTAVVVWQSAGFDDGDGVYGQRYDVGSPLLAEAGARSGKPSADALTGAALPSLVEEATRRWQAAGLSAEQAQALRGVDVRVANLGGATLGLASGHTILLDDNAAGWGWFVDKTPRDDREFTTSGNQGEQNRMDLLSVLMHEMGHALGLDHDGDGVMQETLAAGTRRLPTREEAGALTPPPGRGPASPPATPTVAPGPVGARPQAAADLVFALLSEVTARSKGRGL